jgi:hypothetical protein
MIINAERYDRYSLFFTIFAVFDIFATIRVETVGWLVIVQLEATQKLGIRFLGYEFTIFSFDGRRSGNKVTCNDPHRVYCEKFLVRPI